MIELISYCVLGGCLVWNLGLVFYLCIESAQDEAKMEEVYRQHKNARKEWQKKLAIKAGVFDIQEKM